MFLLYYRLEAILMIWPRCSFESPNWLLYKSSLLFWTTALRYGTCARRIKFFWPGPLGIIPWLASKWYVYYDVSQQVKPRFQSSVGLKSKSIFYSKLHKSKIPIFTKFTFLKSLFSQNSHFWNLIFHKIHIFEMWISG